MDKFGDETHGRNADSTYREAEAQFEQELRSGLQLRPAPEGFADRVLARAEELPRRGASRWPAISFRNPALSGAIAALLLISIGLGGYFERQHERQIAGEHAREQVLLALQITSTTIRDVRNKVDRNYVNRESANGGEKHD